MKPEVIPFERYSGLNPLFLAFLRKNHNHIDRGACAERAEEHFHGAGRSVVFSVGVKRHGMPGRHLRYKFFARNPEKIYN